MRASALFAAAAALPALVSAQNISFIETLETGLLALGLTSLAAAISAVNETSAAQALFAELAVGEWTVFAPSNDAFASVPSNVSSDPNLLAEILTYHTVSGWFSQNSTFPNVTIGRTGLSNTSGLVFLEGNQNQVLAWTNENNVTTVLNQNGTQVLNSTVIQNITVLEINAVLSPPGALSTALAANNLTNAASDLSSAGLLDTLETTHGFTFFAPTNAAFANVSSLVGSNKTELKLLLQNHVLNATTQYTSDFQALSSSASLTSAAGDGLSFSTNSTGTFVTSGNITAQIVVPDIILENGVLHIIDTVLFTNQSNPSAASAAFQSATSVAASLSASPTLPTGPVGFTPSPSASGSGSSSTGGSSSGATSLRVPSFTNAGVAGLFTLLGAAFIAL